MRPLSSILALMAVAGALLVPASQAMAQGPSASGETIWFTSAEVGVGPIGDDLYLHLRPRLTLLRPTSSPICADDQPTCDLLLEATVEAPLRLGLEGDDRGRLRQRDWSQARDATRLIRRLQFGAASDPFSLHLGELGATSLGHGTLVDGFFNRITTDHHALGFRLQAHQPRWEVQTFTNDVLSPYLLGAHLRGRPPVLYDETSSLQRLQVGASLAVDANAPRSLDGDQVTTDAHWPAVQDSQATALLGLELSYPLLRRQRLALTSYADWNHHFDIGRGLHLGLLADLDLSEGVQLSGRLEYRRLSDRYLPDYFDPLYEISRYQFRLHHDASPQPKLSAIANADSQRRHGGRIQLQTRIEGLMSFSASLADASGWTGASLRLRASFDYDERSRFGLFYASQAPGHQSFSASLADLLTFQDSVAVAEGRTQIRGPLYALGQLGRQWQLQSDGTFDSLLLWHLGAGVGAQF